MKGAHHAALYVDHQHRHAVGGLDGQQQIRRVGDQAIASYRLARRSVDAAHDGGVNLFHLHQRPWIASGVRRLHRVQERAAIPLDVGPCVVLGEVEVERLAAVAT